RAAVRAVTSPPGLPRGAILLRKRFIARRMDCRATPGNDDPTTRIRKNASLHADARRANEVCPFGDVGADLGGKRFGRVSDRLKTERRQLLLHARSRDDVDDLAMKERGE